jgi:hypothetical protein
MTAGLSCTTTEINEETIVVMINRMLSDNYTLIVLFLFLIIIIGAITYYFYTELRNTIKFYYRNQGSEEAVKNNPNEDELYEDDNENDDNEVNKHLDSVSGNYFKKVENDYKDYNFQKGQYIINNYRKKESDDIIDRNILFEKKDNYTYDKDE